MGRKADEDASTPTPAPAATRAPVALSEMAKSAPQTTQLRDPAVEPKSGVRVRAKETGFYNGARRRAGTTFLLKEGDKPGSWMDVVKG